MIREQKRKQDLEDQQEVCERTECSPRLSLMSMQIEVGKLKTYKQLQIKKQRDKEKKELNDSLNIKKEMEEQMK